MKTTTMNFLSLSVFSLLLLSFFSSTLQAKNIENVEGAGATFPQPLYQEWAFAFSFIQPDIQVVYDGVGSGLGVASLTAQKVDWAGSDFPQSQDWFEENPTFQQYPFVAGAVVPCYNIPEISGTSNVTLTVQTLAKIFSGKITNWRDSEILDLNPTLRSSFPDKEIEVIYREDSSGTTNIFTEALSFYSRSWNRTQGTFTIWPKDLTKKKNFKPATGNFGIFAEVESSPYSISYISFPFLVESGTLSYANLKVKGDSIARPNDASRVRQAVSKATFDKTRQGSLVEAASKVEGAWPISGFSYLVLDTKNDFSQTDCEVRRGLFKWLRWTLTDENALARAERKGYIPLTPDVASLVLNSLEEVDCRDQQLLGVEVVERHDKAYFDAIFILSMILMFVIIAPGVYFFLWQDYLRLVAKIYSSLLLLGALITYLSVIFFYLEPDRDWVCQCRQWFTALGFTIFFGAVFTRTLHTFRVYRMTTSKHSEVAASKGIVELAAGMGLTFVAQSVILIIWSATDKLSSKLSVRDEINLTAAYVCKSDTIWLWIGLEIAFFTCLLVYGAFVVYATWDVKSKFADGRWILIAIYNMFLTLAAFIPLFIVLVIDDGNLFIMTTVGINFSLASILLCLYLQRFMYLFESRQTSHVGGTTTTETS